MNAKIYSLKDEEISPDTWIVEIAVSYKYEGTLSPIGPSNGEWIDVLYQASPIGFLMTKEGNSYSLQSRYDWLFFLLSSAYETPRRIYP